MKTWEYHCQTIVNIWLKGKPKDVRGKYEWKMKEKGVVAKLLFLISVYEFP